MATSQLGESLNDKEVALITAFLETLNGEMPRIEYPMLPPSTRNTPKPQ